MPRRIVYLPIIADLFNYGHLRILEYAKKMGDYTICGLITDEGILTYRNAAITNYEERKAVLAAIKHVDEILPQSGKDSTENLKEIHRKFPEDKLVLMHGDDWSEVPGSEFIRSVDGEIIQPPYYKRLSTNKIIREVVEKYKDERFQFDLFSDLFRIKDIIQYEEHSPKNVISTKANTLKALQPLLKKSRIEKLFIFDVNSWNKNRASILEKIRNSFSPHKVVVRSSAINEDTLDASMAGYFLSLLDVESSDEKHLEDAIEKVIGSYHRIDSLEGHNQVLIQEQSRNLKMSGVLFTRKLDSKGPYFQINYDDSTGHTDTVTSGKIGNCIEISRFVAEKDIPEKWRNLISAVKEIENIIEDLPLDIEFAVDNNNEVIIFQVRPLVAVKGSLDFSDEFFRNQVLDLKNNFAKSAATSGKIFGNRIAYSDMAFWNPSEIIGDNPNPLDYSLYAHILMDDLWLKGLIPLGYKDISPAPLMARFGNKPYIDLRISFNALFIDTIPEEIQKKLIGHFFTTLEKNPELHDKIEFDIHFSCLDFNFYSRKEELKNILSKEELSVLENNLRDFTVNIIKDHQIILSADSTEIDKLIDRRKMHDRSHAVSLQAKINLVKNLLDDCRMYGTAQFSKVARMAFIGNAIFKSLVNQRVVSQEFYNDFSASVQTVAGEFSNDFSSLAERKISREEFLMKYGHLRPGTYDITSPRYDSIFQNIDSIHSVRPVKSSVHKGFIVDKGVSETISEYFKKMNWQLTAEEFLNYVEVTIRLRELFKFQFTKNLSDAIETIAEAGEMAGLDRNQMAMLDIDSFLQPLQSPVESGKVKDFWCGKMENNKNEKLAKQNLSLPPLIFDERDFDIISYYNAKPNFITAMSAEGSVVFLNSSTNGQVPDLDGKIVLIEKADPGYDWIFSHKINGMITKYGGVASHMAIRCAEFGIPAVIGCGHVLFDKIKNLKSVSLNCEARKINFYE